MRLRTRFWYLWKSCACYVNVGTYPAIFFACPLRVNRRESRADTPRRFGGRENKGTRAEIRGTQTVALGQPSRSKK
jgi:hypothetical protein